MHTMNYPKPRWHPREVVDLTWVSQCFEKYIGNGVRYCLYSNGTCVSLPSGDKPEFDNRLIAVVRRSPDFQVRSVADGNYIIGFRGPVLGFMSGDYLRQNLDRLRKDAIAFGLLAGERLSTDLSNPRDDDMVAGLYVRAMLYLDVEQLKIAKIEPGLV